MGAAENGDSSKHHSGSIQPSASDCYRSADSAAQTAWSDAIAHHSGHMNSALLTLSAEAGAASLGLQAIWSTGMPVTNGGITLIEKWMLRQVMLLHVIENVSIGPAQQRP